MKCWALSWGGVLAFSPKTLFGPVLVFSRGCQSWITRLRLALDHPRFVSSKEAPMTQARVKSPGEASSCQAARSVLAVALQLQGVAGFICIGCWELPEMVPKGLEASTCTRPVGVGRGACEESVGRMTAQMLQNQGKGSTRGLDQAGWAPSLPPHPDCRIWGWTGGAHGRVWEGRRGAAPFRWA